MPFAREESLVAMPLQFLGNGHFFMSQIIAVLRMKKLVSVVVGLSGNPVGDVDPYWVTPGHYAGSGGRANGTSRIAVGELHAGCCKLVYVRSIVELAAVCPDVRPAHVVDEEEDEVGVFLGSES